MTTSMLQQLVYLRHERPGRRAVVVGAEHVSFSALLTLSHGGARAVAMTTEHARHQTLAAFQGRRRGPLPGAASHPHAGQRDSRPPPGRGGRAHRPRHRRDARGRVRPGRLHRGLDPRPRARGAGRHRARPADEGARRRCRPAHHAPRGLRGRQRSPRSRDGRRRRARRPPRRGGRSPPPRRRGVAGRPRSRSAASPRSDGWRRMPSTLARAPTASRRGAGSCCARRRGSIVHGSRSHRRGGSCGPAACDGWTPDARCGSPPRGQRRSSQTAARSLRGSAPR